MLIKANEISPNFWFDILKGSVKLVTRRYREFWNIIIAHGNDNLFPRKTFSYHIDSGFYLFIIVDCVVYIFDFFQDRLGKFS